MVVPAQDFGNVLLFIQLAAVQIVLTPELLQVLGHPKSAGVHQLLDLLDPALDRILGRGHIQPLVLVQLHEALAIPLLALTARRVHDHGYPFATGLDGRGIMHHVLLLAVVLAVQVYDTRIRVYAPPHSGREMPSGIESANVLPVRRELPHLLVVVLQIGSWQSVHLTRTHVRNSFDAGVDHLLALTRIPQVLDELPFLLFGDVRNVPPTRHHQTGSLGDLHHVRIGVKHL